MYSTQALKTLAQSVISLTAEVGQMLCDDYHNPDAHQVQTKANGTVVTASDKQASERLVKAISILTPECPVVSEESPFSDEVTAQTVDQFWLVDPLDGTRGFIDQAGEFSINIALIQQGTPVLGILHSPLSSTTYFAVRGQGAFKQIDGYNHAIATSALHDPLRVIIGVYHNASRYQTALEKITRCEIHKVNSAMKFGLVSEGKMDVYPRMGPTSFWDTAAGQCIVEESGGIVVDFNGNPLQYSFQPNMLNPRFIALGAHDNLQQILSYFEQIRRPS